MRTGKKRLDYMQIPCEKKFTTLVYFLRVVVLVKFQMKTIFFWEKITRGKGKSRFNLLLLEYGEYFFEDFGAHLIVYDGTQRKTIQGRLKICSRSIVFEPNEIRRPISRFSFKFFCGTPQTLSTQMIADIRLASISGLLSIDCTSFWEMKAGDKIEPYHLVDTVLKFRGSSVLFALINTDAEVLLTKMKNCLSVFQLANKEGWGAADVELHRLMALLQPKFDSSQLVC